jgi:demethylmacrocin O-methyltransferase
MFNDLTTIANYHGTDKGTTVAQAHGYTPYYEELFAPLREKPITLLEIGVADTRFPGASLKVWEDYFTQAKIVGFDIVDCTRFSTPRTHIFHGDQGNVFDLVACGCKHGPFDIVIDDGSHAAQHQITSFYTLFPLLVKPGGIYIIEDLHVAPATVAHFKTCFDPRLHRGTAGWKFLIKDKLLMVKREE